MRLIIEDKKKRKKNVIYTLKRNAGNVERGIEMFNASTNTGSLGMSQGMAESLTENKQPKRKLVIRRKHDSKHI